MAEDDLRRLASDPTALTTAMLLREIANLREKIEIRLDAMDKAMTLFQENLTRVPTEVQKEVGHLKELHDQKFADIHAQLRERSERRTLEKKAAEDALAAALAAQKELAAAQDTANAAAISKSQEATDKQVDSIKSAAEAIKASLDDKIAIINGRLDRGEGGHAGASEYKKDSRDNTSMFIAGLALLAAIALHFIK